MHTTILYIFVMVTTHQRFKTEVCNIKQKGPEGKPTKPSKITTHTHTHAKQNKPDRKCGKPRDVTYMWDINLKPTNKQDEKRETHGRGQQTSGYHRVRGAGPGGR